MDMVDDKDLLAKEIQSWDSFKYALRNSVLFDQMLKECHTEQLANAID
jgi:hypothetical protein